MWINSIILIFINMKIVVPVFWHFAVFLSKVYMKREARNTYPHKIHTYTNETIMFYEGYWFFYIHILIWIESQAY